MFRNIPVEVAVTAGLAALVGELLIAFLFWHSHGAVAMPEIEVKVLVAMIAPIVMAAALAPVFHILLARTTLREHERSARRIGKSNRLQEAVQVRKSGGQFAENHHLPSAVTFPEKSAGVRS